MLRQIFLFLGVGGATAVLYLVLLFLFIDTFYWPYLVAVSLAYAVSISFHFYFNREITFKKSDARVVSQVIKYVVVAGVNYFVTLLVVWFIVERLFFSVYVGVALSFLMTTLLGFFLFKHWVFREKASRV
jgi:putative flippase GtrA